MPQGRAHEGRYRWLGTRLSVLGNGIWAGSASEAAMLQGPDMRGPRELPSTPLRMAEGRVSV